MSGARRAVLEIEGLAVRGPRGALLAPSSVVLYEGERALLVGPSGAGKSLVTDVLLGFLPEPHGGLQVSGRVRLDGRELLGADVGERRGRVGAVFQLQAPGLFDDLSAAQNLAFGARDGAACQALAARLGLSALERPVALLSGGERVRLGLARTLLSGPDVLVADEPTTGLDPAAAAQVVEALRAAHRRLTLVITHDQAAFQGFADAVLLLDPADRTLRRLPAGPEADAALARALAPRADAPPKPPGPAGPARAGLGARLAAGWLRRAVGTADTLGDVGCLLLLPRTLADSLHPLHGPRVRAALRRDLAPGVGLFTGLSAVLVSLTATFFLFDRLPRRDYTEPLLQDELLTGLGLILTRVVVPLIASILLAAKLGASTAAHLGHLSLTRQVDALRLLGVSPRRHLLLPAALGQLLAAWLWTALSVGLAFLATSVVFLWQHPGWSALYARTAWFRGLHAEDALWVGAKAGLAALAVSVTAYRCATAQRKRAPEQVLAALHRTLLVGLLLVLAVHAACAFVEF